ncbi:unnamed protein product [Medioppia subpectinata]|uniref:Rieske domain-containing protein n=1 Tax=Medioppia subpectinata TaxID=1979941 RepID=A0A7R9Q756_9ACAR|nr:unnamed protein product [Medioppia subpectinata]CAG2115381.1 unnamed protein product [Medioppia subpectinata]
MNNETHTAQFDEETFDGYPNTWVMIMTSTELATNSVKPFEMCGQQLVAFRGASGAVHVLSAYCPHLGANLGIGGHVVSESGDDCIQCPFHGWRFGGRDGQCKRIPNIETSEMNKLNASVKHWETIEMNMMIFVWYHKDDAQPDHYPHDFMADCNQKLIVMENAVDEEHLITVHANIMLGVASTFEKQTPAKVAGAKSITGAWLIKFTCYSPLYCINYINSVSTVCVTAGTPLRPNKTTLNVLYFAPPGLFYRLIAELATFSFKLEIEKDDKIWEALRRPKRPIFTSNDELIIKLKYTISDQIN